MSSKDVDVRLQLGSVFVFYITDLMLRLLINEHINHVEIRQSIVEILQNCY